MFGNVTRATASISGLPPGGARVGLGAWVVVDNVTGGGESATKDATALTDDLSAAAMANDGAKAMTMITADAVLWSNVT